MRTTITVCLGVAALVALATVAAFGPGTTVPKAVQQPTVDAGSVLWVRGSIPPGPQFAAIFIPTCWECNDYTGPILARDQCIKNGIPYVLVVGGGGSSIDKANEAFGPKWPNIAVIPKETYHTLGGSVGDIGVFTHDARKWTLETILRRKKAGGVEKLKERLRDAVNKAR